MKLVLLRGCAQEAESSLLPEEWRITNKPKEALSAPYPFRFTTACVSNFIASITLDTSAQKLSDSTQPAYLHHCSYYHPFLAWCCLLLPLSCWKYISIFMYYSPLEQTYPWTESTTIKREHLRLGATAFSRGTCNNFKHRSKGCIKKRARPFPRSVSS